MLKERRDNYHPETDDGYRCRIMKFLSQVTKDFNCGLWRYSVFNNDLISSSTASGAELDKIGERHRIFRLTQEALAVDAERHKCDHQSRSSVMTDISINTIVHLVKMPIHPMKIMQASGIQLGDIGVVTRLADKGLISVIFSGRGEFWLEREHISVTEKQANDTREI
jgi:hypothetical protein